MLATALALWVAAAPDAQPDSNERSAAHYLVPAAEVTVFEVGLWLTDRFVLDADFARVTPATIRSNFVNGPRFDNDAIFTNFLGHPYHGALPYSFARSSGLGFWLSSLYALTGDVAWEWLAEVQAPSINDLVESGPAASFWGEALYRIARLMLARRPDGPWAEALRALFALAIDPPATFNHVVAPTLDDEPDPLDVHYRARLYGGALGWAGSSWRWQGLAGADLWYGMPSEPASGCLAPFDQFELHVAGGFGGTVSGDGGVRGLIAGCHFGERGPAGTWGLHGSTDFGTGNGFRWSATSLGPGATIAFHGAGWQLRATANAEAVLMGAAGSVAQTDYVEPNDTVPGFSRYSMGPGALGRLALELGLGDRFWVRGSAQTWGVAALVPAGGGWERIDEATLALQVDLPLSLFAGAELTAAARSPARRIDAAQSGWSMRGALGVRLGH